MTAPGRAELDRALQAARRAAYGEADDVGQEGFAGGREIRDLAVRAGVGPGTRLLDLCCGVSGPGRFLTTELGCRYVGVDASPDAIAVARSRHRADSELVAARVPPAPRGPFDVVLLLETFLAFPDKQALVDDVASVLVTGGRFALTVEEGPPLTADERRLMPAADTVWPVPLPELLEVLERAGLVVRWCADHTPAHRRHASALRAAYAADRVAISRAVGAGTLAGLLASHRVWCEWLASGRVRKLALVAERLPAVDPG